MSFTVPNETDAFHADQAELDANDVAILIAGLAGTTVLSGCAVTAQGVPDMTVAVAAGVVVIANVQVTVASGNVNIGAADATNPRFDLIVVDNAGTKSATAGTAAANPVFPAIPANSVVLAAVYVPANDTTIEADHITDKRVMTADAYALLSGRPGGQSVYGGNAANENITIGGTSHGTHTTSIISMLDDVRIASGKVIQDSAGGTRITLSTTGLTLTGAIQVEPAYTAAGGTAFSIAPTATGLTAAVTMVTLNPTISNAAAANGITVTALGGVAGFSVRGGTTGHVMYGLNFTARINMTTAQIADGESATVATIIGSQLAVALSALFIGSGTRTINITDAAALNIVALSAGLSGAGTTQFNVTAYHGVRVNAIAISNAEFAVTTAINLYVGDITGTSFTAANNRIVQFGSATPTTTSGLFEMVANFSAAANQTPIYISEGATPTRRQLRTKDGAAIGGGDLVCVLV